MKASNFIRLNRTEVHNTVKGHGYRLRLSRHNGGKRVLPQKEEADWKQPEQSGMLPLF